MKPSIASSETGALNLKAEGTGPEAGPPPVIA